MHTMIPNHNPVDDRYDDDTANWHWCCCWCMVPACKSAWGVKWTSNPRWAHIPFTIYYSRTVSLPGIGEELPHMTSLTILRGLKLRCCIVSSASSCTRVWFRHRMMFTMKCNDKSFAHYSKCCLCPAWLTAWNISSVRESSKWCDGR